MARRVVKCPHCRKNKRMLDVLDCKGSAVIEYKCPRCGSKWEITVRGDDIKIEEAKQSA